MTVSLKIKVNLRFVISGNVLQNWFGVMEEKNVALSKVDE